MVAVISNNEHIQKIEKAMENCKQKIIYRSSSCFDTVKEFERIKKHSITILVVDLTYIKSEKILLNCLKDYRVFKSNTRIIIFAPERHYGDRTLREIVNMGIYDIVAPQKKELSMATEMLEKNLLEKGDYTRAVKWTEKNFWSFGIKTEQKVVGTVFIGVTELENGNGCTYLSINLASLLSQKYRTAYIEMSAENPQIAHIKETYRTVPIENQEGDRYKENIGFSLGGIDFYPYTEKDMGEIFERNYNYVVFDFGKSTNFNKEMELCNHKILVYGKNLWESNRLKDFCTQNQSFFVYINFLESEDFKLLKAQIKSSKVYKAIFSPNPFKVTREQKVLLTKLIN